MSLYNKLFSTLVNNPEINSITTDIFDTVLLRNMWPEGLQFYETAGDFLPLLRNSINNSITTYEIYSYREYIRKELLDAKNKQRDNDVKLDNDNNIILRNDVDISLDEWFNALVEILQIKYNGKVNKNNTELVNHLIEIELNHEKSHLKPNTRLINILKTLKKAFPRLKIYYISDMYLSSSQTNELLRYNNIDIFDGGITSSEAMYGKFSGKIFHYLHNKDSGTFQDFNVYNNIHIGDNKFSDYNMAIQSGSQAVYYHVPRLRKLRTFIGRYKLHEIKKVAYQQESQSFDKLLLNKDKFTATPVNILNDMGLLFSQPMLIYLLHIGLLSNNTDSRYMFVSSEAKTFTNIGKIMFGSLFNKVETATKLNRKRSIKALVYEMIEQQKPEYMESIVKTILLGEVDNYRKDIYEFLLTKDYPISQMTLNQQSDDDFYKVLYENIRQADKKYTNHLKEAYSYVKSLIPNDNNPIVICDVGWGGTTQAIFSQFLELKGIKNPISGIYIGCHSASRFNIRDIDNEIEGYLIPDVLSKKYKPMWNAIIWEYVYTNKVQFPDDALRLHMIHKGMSSGYKYFRQTHICPTELFNKVIAPKIRRLLTKPTIQEIKTIGSVNYDLGFNETKTLKIINLNHSSLSVYHELICRPRHTIKATVLAPNAWSYGYMRYYHLYGLEILLKIAGIINKKEYL